MRCGTWFRMADQKPKLPSCTGDGDHCNGIRCAACDGCLCSKCGTVFNPADSEIDTIDCDLCGEEQCWICPTCDYAWTEIHDKRARLPE